MKQHLILKLNDYMIYIKRYMIIIHSQSIFSQQGRHAIKT